MLTTTPLPDLVKCPSCNEAGHLIITVSDGDKPARPPRKRLVHTVDLRFFRDNATGDYGLTHKDTMDANGGDGFNAFWTATGIFHDVFEHWFEHVHPHFCEYPYAMNVGGEMAASGAMWYYYARLGVSERDINPRSMYPMAEQMRRSTESLCIEAVSEGYCQFGDELECRVPRQRSVNDYDLESQIDELYQNVRDYKRRDYFKGLQSAAIEEEQTRERLFGEAYRHSVTRGKVANLHRWGYRMAERLIPHTYENRDTLVDFLAFWGDFCKRNPAEDLANVAKGITFKVYRAAGKISWEAYLVPQYGSGLSEILITKRFSVDDLYPAIED